MWTDPSVEGAPSADSAGELVSEEAVGVARPFDGNSSAAAGLSVLRNLPIFFDRRTAAVRFEDGRRKRGSE